MESELEAEQEFVDLAYARLDAMRGDANSMLEGVLDLGRGGTFQSRTERDVIVRTSLARLEQLDIGDQALTFGRIDRRRRATGRRTAAGRRRGDVPHRPPGHPRPRPRAAGRRLAGPGGRALLPGHRAGPARLVRRRHLALQGRTRARARGRAFGDPGAARRATGWPGPTAATGPADGGRASSSSGTCPSAGPAALLAALDRARTGRMADIVATIQREQDEIIRAPLSGVLVVQGGPGTGKTAVALHRAAYLLYTHRFPLERQGVLVVGPNPLFLRYIEQVLPVAGRDRGHPVDRGRAGARDPGPGERPGRRGPAEGRRAHGQGAGPGRAHPPAAAAPTTSRSPTARWSCG